MLHSEKTYLTFGNTSEIIKHSLAARVSYISLVFSNSLRVLSQCNTQLRFLTNSGSNKFLTTYIINCLVVKLVWSWEMHASLVSMDQTKT